MRRPVAPVDAKFDWSEADRELIGDDEWAVRLLTARAGNEWPATKDPAAIQARYHPARRPAEDERAGAGTTATTAATGAIWVGGAGGGLDGPACGSYPEACRRLQQAGVAGLRLHYPHPNHLDECVLDTLVGIDFLAREGVRRVALVGHSFGGAVVITAGALSPRVGAVVPMSTQTYGTDLAPEIAPRPLLLIHGTHDEILPDSCSRQVYDRAGEPKRLKLYPGARHGLDEVREEVLDLLVAWIPGALAERSPRGVS